MDILVSSLSGQHLFLSGYSEPTDLRFGIRMNSGPENRSSNSPGSYETFQQPSHVLCSSFGSEIFGFDLNQFGLNGGHTWSGVLVSNVPWENNKQEPSSRDTKFMNLFKLEFVHLKIEFFVRKAAFGFGFHHMHFY